MQPITSSDHVCKTYNNFINSCLRFQTSEKKEKMLIPCIYIKPNGNNEKSFNGKIMLSVVVKVF